MARILYGISGDGGGHAGRAKAIIPHLLSQGHELQIVSYDRGYRLLKPFFEVQEITGLSMTYNQKNEIENVRTVLDNLLKTPKIKKSIDAVLRIVHDFHPDIVISDFEAITALVANLKRIPLLSIDNQHQITKTKIEYPKKYELDATKVRAVINFIVFNAKNYIITTFFPTKILDKRAILVPPIVRQDIFSATPQNNGFILVYLTSQYKDILEVLKLIRKNFVVYGFDQQKNLGNVILKKNSDVGFVSDLASCDGVIANAGFSLISEALYLGKPYLALPVKGQFEQTLNAIYLEKLGYGKHWDEIDREKIESFLFNLPWYQKTLENYPRTDNSFFFSTLDSVIQSILSQK